MDGWMALPHPSPAQTLIALPSLPHTPPSRSRAFFSTRRVYSRRRFHLKRLRLFALPFPQLLRGLHRWRAPRLLLLPLVAPEASSAIPRRAEGRTRCKETSGEVIVSGQQPRKYTWLLVADTDMSYQIPNTTGQGRKNEAKTNSGYTTR